MAFKHSTLPMWLQDGISGVLRSTITLPLSLGLGPAVGVGRGAGRLFANLPFNKRHVRRAVQNLDIAFPDWSAERKRELAIASYEHLMQLGVELAYTPRLVNHDGWSKQVRLGDVSKALTSLLRGEPCILVSGHCGNWELVGYTVSMLGFPMQAVYRPLDLKPLDNWVRESRQKRGLTLVSKFGAVRELPEGLQRGVPAGLVADQNGGDYGVFVPFFGRLTSTYKSVGILAMQFNATVICGVARRLQPGEQPDPSTTIATVRSDDSRDGMNYVIELVDQFGPADWESQPDRLYYITARYRRSIEKMVRRSPEQYLWMHRIWRSRPPHERKDREFPGALRDKLAALPWMNETELQSIIARSDEDRRMIREKEDHGFRIAGQ
ncbi:MAG: lysophospholipid acyltransferase family protein [Phycisphaerales bacterium]|nr:lysophospholipid acyltransferase family protein [Phycisphaerales bacterium]